MRQLAALLFFSCTVFAAEPQSVTFTFSAPDAQSVSLAGEFSDWKLLPMERGEDGVWRREEQLAPGTYGYKFVVNGDQWHFDPATTERKTLDGVENSAVTVGGGGETTPAPAAESTPATEQVTLGGKSLTPREPVQFEIPMPDEVWSRAEFFMKRLDGQKLKQPSVVGIIISAPENFDPKQQWPILLVNNTAQGSSVEHFQAYYRTANDAGYVAVAADAAEMPGEKEDWPPRRWALDAAALDFFAKEWPNSQQWPVATAGFSGGGKYSGWVGAMMSKEGRKLIGIWMGGVNDDTATKGLEKIRPSRSEFRQTPIYLSSGSTDDIATPSQVASVKASMESVGFRNVKLGEFDGAHVIHEPHLAEALEWFKAEAGK